MQENISLLTRMSKKSERVLDYYFKINGNIAPVSTIFAQSLPREILRCYCYYNGIYGLVTNEIVSYLEKLIRGKKTIEIGSGNGTLGRALGIKITKKALARKAQCLSFGI